MVTWDEPSVISTHHWDDWTLDALVAARGDQRVSLVVPARNEAATVGDVVSRVRAALVDTAALLDEIVVIDSDSTDATYAVATDAGAVVHRSAEIRPELGSFPGKGEAMWKSLFVTRGDLIVFMDADLTDWDTHFVPGLLGPLLTDPGTLLVKGFYERPGERGALDGGRVTELVARPLVALDYPDLVGVVQPLAGEWAVRRSLFETLSVPDRLRRRAGRAHRHRRHPRRPGPGPGGSRPPRPRSSAAARPRRDGHPDPGRGRPAAGGLDGPDTTRDGDEVVLTQYESRDGLLTLLPRSVPVRERPPAVSA